MEPSLSENKNARPMFKSKLQELLQKAGHTPPLYQSRNEGSAHGPKFRASVLVGGTRYISELTYTDLKAAEQDAAKVAYESVKNTNLTPPLGKLYIHQEPRFTKSILHEYAVKMNLGIPKYQTLPEGEGFYFKSSINYCGKIYIGVADSKKVAEQIAAKEAVRSLLVSDSGTLHHIIHSKERMYASMFAKMKSAREGNPGTATAAVSNTGNGMRRRPELKPTEGNPGPSMASGSGMRRRPELKPAEGNPGPSMAFGSGMRRRPELKPAEGNPGPSMASGSGMRRRPELKPAEGNPGPSMASGSGVRRRPELKLTEGNPGPSTATAPNAGRGLKRKPELKQAEGTTRN